MGGVFAQQALTGFVIGLYEPSLTDSVRIYPPEAYRAVFALIALEIGLALLIYRFGKCLSRSIKKVINIITLDISYMFFKIIFKIRSARLAFICRIRHKGLRGDDLAADALLGRFLPRLGPLVYSRAASFLSGGFFPNFGLFSSQPVVW